VLWIPTGPLWQNQIQPKINWNEKISDSNISGIKEPNPVTVSGLVAVFWLLSKRIDGKGTAGC
jgi:hypothetical protein